jgi:hypothetical protein
MVPFLCGSILSLPERNEVPEIVGQTLHLVRCRAAKTASRGDCRIRLSSDFVWLACVDATISKVSRL